MSASVEDSPQVTHLDVGAVRIGLRQVIASELIKLRTLHATKLLTLSLLICFWGLGVLYTVITADKLAEAAGAGVSAEVSGNVAALPGAGLALGGVLFAILGAISVTSEYSSGTIAPSLQVVPRRTLLLAAKAVVLSVWSALVTALGAGGSVLIGYIMLPSHGYTPRLGDPVMLRNAGCTFLAAVGLALLGFSLGFLMRTSVGAILSVVLLFTLVPGLVGMVPHVFTGLAVGLPSSLLVTALATIDKSAAAVWGAGFGLLAWGAVSTMIAAFVFMRRSVVR